MDLDLRNKNVLITGGSKGIGLACAKAFLAEGARVAIVSRSENNLVAAVSQLGSVTTAAADLVDPGAARLMVDQVDKALGSIDVLVNSAGAAKRTAPDELTPEKWRTAMDAKFFSYI